MTLGQVISELARQAFAQQSGMPGSSPVASEPLARRGSVVSNALIDRLRDEQGI